MFKLLKLNFTSRRQDIFGLVGAGGFGREILPLEGKMDLVGVNAQKFRGVKHYFVDSNFAMKEINSVPIVSEQQFLADKASGKYFNVAISDPYLREKISKRLIESNVEPVSLISRSSELSQSSVIGVGAIFCSTSILTANTTIGRFFQANIYSYIAHDCVIGDFVTFAPKVACNGNVHIGDHAYIGTSATIKQGTKENPIYIGKSSIVGMGAVVTKDVPDHAVVVGNPARIIRYTNE